MSTKKPTPQKEYVNTLTVMEPAKVRCSRDGRSLLLFVNNKTIIILSKNFIDAVMSRKYQQKRGA